MYYDIFQFPIPSWFAKKWTEVMMMIVSHGNRILYNGLRPQTEVVSQDALMIFTAS